MRLRSNKTTFGNVQENMQFKVHGSLHKHKKIPCPNVCDAQTSSKKFVGVSKTSTGYVICCKNMESCEEKTVQGKRVQGVVCDEKIKKVVDQRDQCLENQDSRESRVSKGKKKCDMLLEKKMAGVSKRKSKKYCARIRHPISKKEIWLGTFSSAEEAAMVYLEKKTELEKETQGLNLLFAKMMESGKVLISWVQFFKKIITIHV
ncbi:hypothetical protein LIER_35020 [Lithospermum erythrorhizon]|uniref:AP2/ERF domain-containing protein n=1 Tax=Lithospermum erythrorhizon TaxID=34254 RepID=A0AAV3NMZ8_LITER